VEQLEIEPTQDPFGISLSGEIDMSSAPVLLEALLIALADGRPVTVDMRRVTFIDSSGLNAIVSSAAESSSRDPLILKDPSAAVRRVLDLFGMEQMPQIRVVGVDDGG
jgi:anti-anti-sigma factor